MDETLEAIAAGINTYMAAHKIEIMSIERFTVGGVWWRVSFTRPGESTLDATGHTRLFIDYMAGYGPTLTEACVQGLLTGNEATE